MNPDCWFGDHNWRGTGACSCGERLRCACGAFITESGLLSHVVHCRANPLGLRLRKQGDRVNEVCETCDGEGELWGVWSEEHRRFVNIRCPDCVSGTGSTPQPGVGS